MADGGRRDERERHSELQKFAPGHSGDANKAYLGRGTRPWPTAATLALSVRICC
jgi:hypothetical protein